MNDTPEHDRWLCPNTPRCGHGSTLHDGDGNDEPFMCCVEDCDCGRAAVPAVAAGQAVRRE